MDKYEVRALLRTCERERALDASAAHVPKTSSAVAASDVGRVFAGVACVPAFGGVIPSYVHTTFARSRGTFKSGTLRREVIVRPESTIDRAWGSI